MAGIIDYQFLKYLAIGAWTLLGAYRGHTTYISGFRNREDPKYYYTNNIGFMFIGATIHASLGHLMSICPPATIFIGVTEIYNLEDWIRGRND
jgi:hypothetical protein